MTLIREGSTLADAKAKRSKRRQLGQWMTPPKLAQRIVEDLELTRDTRVLEPSFGDGSFLIALIDRFMTFYEGSASERLSRILADNVWGVELDPFLYERAVESLADRYGPLPEEHNLVLGDFFAVEFLAGTFDVVVGNPPYGGTFDPELEDQLDRLYGRWNELKLKKETYSFFTARSLEWLVEDGVLAFIISDTMLTISTMAGLRARLMDTTEPDVEELPSFSEETTQPTLVLSARKRAEGSDFILRNGQKIHRDLIEATGNLSWNINPGSARYFRGPKLGQFIVCSSGMTIGNNELFVREIQDDSIVEPYRFDFFDDPITLSRERERARLNRLSAKKESEIRAQEARGETRRNLRVLPLDSPERVTLPHPDYRFYNKADTGIVYSPPAWVVYWKDDGDGVRTFKKNGNWYLHGVGGRPFFEREGLTWHLISSRLKMRYLPEGYILDSGAPCAFLRDGVESDELWFILGWCLTTTATDLLKGVINHTRNVQSKDVERLPYPWWIEEDSKSVIVERVQKLVAEAMTGKVFQFGDPDLRALDEMFAWRDA